ncbi:hypothetical protein PVAP13_5KG305014 [Panicum virgatum]|uniref:Uncharacterized protein n=1 Tax=Panicum virgatum TaxID=38727 RepID=A0A8T0SN81_PANVG|nr:hypothetical protein PVAP13_5KG305014 [Panicum virgatum]
MGVLRAGAVWPPPSPPLDPARHPPPPVRAVGVAGWWRSRRARKRRSGSRWTYGGAVPACRSCGGGAGMAGRGVPLLLPPARRARQPRASGGGPRPRRRPSSAPSPFPSPGRALRQAAVERCPAREEAGEQRPEPAPRTSSCARRPLPPHI